MKRHGDSRKRLIALGHELSRLSDEHRVLEEQVAFLRGIADDLEQHAVVADMPLAGREHRAAQEDLRRARQALADVADRIAAARAEQDALLEQW